MFEHSKKVPRLYKFAAKVAKQVKEEGASLKNLVYQLNHRNIKGLYALISTLLKKSNTLDYLIRSTQILIKENRLDPWLARVLMTELLWGKKRLPNDNKPCQTIINYSNELTECLATFTDDTPSKEPIKVTKPRYVRVNTLKLTMTEVINIFRDEGWILLRCGDNSDYGSFLATVASLGYDQFIVDMHIKDLLVFPPNTQFYNHHLYLNGDIILQDKASCLAPLILSPESKSSVLDMCSAPGMKASHLAAIIGTEGIVYAVERDQRRYQTLVSLMEGMSAENVKCINKDVLTITDRDFPDIEYILVDPSCSGSGMLDRLDYEDPESKCNKSRLQSLAGFQITILRHALNNFPKVKRVLYSTCSVYPEENESVVEQVITTVKDFKLIDLKKKMKSKWFNFGSKDFGSIGERCLYAKPEQDYTNGFFVALFERLKSEETNEFFVRRVKRSSECDNDGYFYNNPNRNANKENNNPDSTKENRKKKKSKNAEASAEIIENITVTEEQNVAEESMIKKKKKKTKHEENINEEIPLNVDTSEEPKLKKKKKSKNNASLKSDINALDISDQIKQKKKRKSEIDDYKNESFNIDENISEETKSKKKKKSKNNETSDMDITRDETKQKKKKKSKIVECKNETTNEPSNVDENIEETKSKKKKKSKNNVTIISDIDTTQEISDETKQKKKKKPNKDTLIENTDELGTENKKRKKKHDINESEVIVDGGNKKKKKSKYAE